jgi:hypothetical protein
MGGTAPANQLRLSFTGSEDGEAETETPYADLSGLFSSLLSEKDGRVKTKGLPFDT